MSAPTIIGQHWETEPIQARAHRRRPSLTEVGQGVCGLMMLIGLFMILPVGWFLLVVGVVGLAGFWAVEYFASAPPTESDGT